MSLPLVETQFFELETPLSLRYGGELSHVRVAYEMYGEMNADKSNVILLFHALTGSQHAYGYNDHVPGVGKFWREENFEGWWNAQIGPNRSMNTDKFCVICANLLGGCYGTTGPTSVNSKTGQPWRGDFPRVSTTDQAHMHAALLDSLGVSKLHAMICPSVGGLVGLTFALLYPERVDHIIQIGSGYRNSMINRLMLFEQIMAIEMDPHFKGGFYDADDPPTAGLALARIISHKSFVCLESLEKRARPEVGMQSNFLSWYQLQSSSESYMLHQGSKFALRFDANSYLRIADMWAHFDATTELGGNSLIELLESTRAYGHKWLVFSIDSDLCFKPSEQLDFVHQLITAGLEAEFVSIHSEKGHDSFLLEPEKYDPYIIPFLNE